jgi:hypothetical protein
MKIPHLNKKFVIPVIALVLVSGAAVGADSVLHSSNTASITFHHPTATGTQEVTQNSPTKPTPTPVDTTGSSSGSGTSSAAQQQAANEAKDQSLMAQSNAPTATATSPTADPSQCGTIEAQEQSAIAPLAAQIKQLETSIQGEYAAITGPEAYTGQAAATIDSEIQTQENQVNSDISKINTIETPYSQQLGYNGCG